MESKAMKIKIIRAAFIKALADMPMEFGSKEFCARARDYGVPLANTRQGFAAPFLKEFCTQVDGPNTRTWAKHIQLDAPYRMDPNWPTGNSKADPIERIFDFYQICNQHAAPVTIEFYKALSEFFSK